MNQVPFRKLRCLCRQIWLRQMSAWQGPRPALSQTIPILV